MKTVHWILVLSLGAGLGAAPALLSERAAPADPGATALVQLAGVYSSLADSILANKRTEKSVVLGVLKVERDLVLAALDRTLEFPSSAATQLRTAAQRMGEFATEGGAVIEPIRNRLLQGGHHHHAQDSGPEAVYDKGYVVLNRKHKLKVLELAKRCARLGEASERSMDDVKALRAEFAALAAKCL